MFMFFNDTYISANMYRFIDSVCKNNTFYNKKYASFYTKYQSCTNTTFKELPYLSKDELIKYNDEMISAPYKKCNLKCVGSCLYDPFWYDAECSIGQSTGGTSGKSAFVWMNRYDAYMYIYTFMTSFKKNGYTYGDKIMVLYPANSYFTNEYEKTNYMLSFFNIRFMTFNKIDKEKTFEFVNACNEYKPDFIVIFPFVLLQLCIHMNRHSIKLHHYPKNINLSGEFLLNCSLHFCKKTFIHSNIENTYGAVEFGEIAHQVKGDKNTFEVFNQFCFLENRNDKIVVTSFINNTFPIIRYEMEDIGTIVNKNGKQYIKNLIGKNTNQIIIQNRIFSALDVDRLIDTVNISHNIIAIVIKYDTYSIDINYIVYEEYTMQEKMEIMKRSQVFMNDFFNNISYTVAFLLHYEHDYLKKFKIIMKRDNTDNEPVGGFFKYH